MLASECGQLIRILLDRSFCEQWWGSIDDGDVIDRSVLPKNYNIYNILLKMFINLEHAVAQLVLALSYKPEGRGFDSR